MTQTSDICWSRHCHITGMPSVHIMNGNKTDKLMLVLTDMLNKTFLWYICDILYLIILAIQNIYIMLLAVLEVLSNMPSIYLHVILR